MEFEDLVETQNVDDIIAQFDNADDVSDDIVDINVDDLLKDDLVFSTLNSSDTDNNDNNNNNLKPKLTSTLPTPIAPQKDDNNVPDLPNTISRYITEQKTAPSQPPPPIPPPQQPQQPEPEEEELDIEKILNDSKIDNDANDENDELLEFDPYNITIEGDKKEDSKPQHTAHLNKYNDIDLDSISNLLKREEIRIKQKMEKGNYLMVQPLTKRMNNNTLNPDSNSESFFKLQLYENITKTLSSFYAEYGTVTVIKTHFKFIAIGMKNGSVFIFDHFEQLKIELNATIACSVTSLDFNHNGTLLIAGYYNGQLILWDVLNNKQLKKIKDAHCSPIIFVIFYKRSSLKSGGIRIASADSKGIMFTWSFTKIFFSFQVDRSTLFNGQRAGILYDIAAYKPTLNRQNNNIFSSLSLCAVANNESVFFVTLEPPFTLKQTILLPNTNINDIKRGALPLLAWRLSYAVNDSVDNDDNNPVLAVGSGTVIQLIQVFIRDENKSKFAASRDTALIRMRGIGQIQLDKLVISMRWLNQQNLIILTANDEILICNNMCVTETIWPCSNKKINMDFFIRHSHFGANIVSFKNCFEIICGLDPTGQSNKLLIITNNNIVTAHCMTWYDRINKLITEGEWIKACCLIIEFFNQYETGKIQQSNSVKKLLKKIDSYILEFCQFVVQSNKISDDELESFGGVAMDYCVCLKRTQKLLFDKVYKILLNNGGREIFFKLLEPYILNDRISTLPPEFMQNFADFLVSKDKINELQQIILHLTPHSFDIHQIVSICREHKLFIALCYLYNEACLDYGEPVKDMYSKIICTENEDNISVIVQRGYQLILYLKYTINGTTFPWCNVLQTPLKAKQQILQVLFDKSEQYQILRHLLALDLRQVLFNIIKVAFEDKHLFSRTSIVGTLPSSPNTSTFESDEYYNNNTPKQPRTPTQRTRRTSIQIKGMLSNAQSAVMTGAKWAWSFSAMSSKHTSPSTSRRNSSLEKMNIEKLNAHKRDVLDPNITLTSKQEMFDVLVKIVIEEENNVQENELQLVKHAESEIFYEFCTPLLASGECEVAVTLLKSVLDYLFCESGKLLNKIDTVKREKETVINKEKERMERELRRLISTQDNFENTILILLSRKMEENGKYFNIQQLLRSAKQCQFHKVELYLHRESGNHSAVIDSYLSDQDLQCQVFDYINNLFYDIKHMEENNAQKDQNKNQNKNKFISIIQIVLKRLCKLVVINSEECVSLIFHWFPQYFDNAIGSLQHNHRTQYLFLRQIVASKQVMENIDQRDSDTKMSHLERLLYEMKFVFSRQQHELYIRLLCEFESESGAVLSYISANSDSFDIELIERYCEKYQVLDASAYLRERSGDSIGALQLILKSIDNGILSLWDVFKTDYDATPPRITTQNVKNNSYYINNVRINKIMDELVMAIGLCRRHQNQTKKKPLWNYLLDSCLISQQKINNCIKTPSYRHKYPSSEMRYLMKQTVNDIVSKTLTAMMSEKNIDLCDMFEKLVDKESSEKYEYYRDTIDVMLSTYKYETDMLKTANNLFRSGFHREYKNHINTSQAAYNCANDKVCKICDITVNDQNTTQRLRLFYCGHLFHQQCLYIFQSKQAENDYNNLCPICHSNSDMKLLNSNINSNEKKSTEKTKNVEIQMRHYAKKLNRLKAKIRARERRMEASKESDEVWLSLAPKDKESLPKSAFMNMHIVVPNWNVQFENNKHNTCVIEID